MKRKLIGTVKVYMSVKDGVETYETVWPRKLYLTVNGGGVYRVDHGGLHPETDLLREATKLLRECNATVTPFGCELRHKIDVFLGKVKL